MRYLLAVQHGDGIDGLIIRAHLDKSDALTGTKRVAQDPAGHHHSMLLQACYAFTWLAGSLVCCTRDMHDGKCMQDCHANLKQLHVIQTPDIGSKL